MRRLMWIPGFLIINYSCAQQEINSKHPEKEINQQAANNITQLELTGEWTCYKKFIDYKVKEQLIFLDADSFWLPGSSNLIFNNDTMWHFDYPREYYASHSFKIKNNELMISQGANNKWELSKLELNGDSLVRVMESDPRFIMTEYYVRDTLDEGIIQLLIRDSVNTKELIGLWVLETSIHQEDGSEPYEIVFPFELPDSLLFHNQELPSSKIKGRIITINIDGKPKEFRFGFMTEQRSSNQILWLRPTTWHKGEEVWIHYHKF